MKANVQYNDFKGSAAADIADHWNLEDFLKSKGFDTERFRPIGANFYSGYSSFFSASIICVDKKKSTEEKEHLTSIGLNNELTRDEFFDLFKRFNVIITNRNEGYEDKTIDEEL